MRDIATSAAPARGVRASHAFGYVTDELVSIVVPVDYY